MRLYLMLSEQDGGCLNISWQDNMGPSEGAPMTLAFPFYSAQNDHIMHIKTTRSLHPACIWGGDTRMALNSHLQAASDTMSIFHVREFRSLPRNLLECQSVILSALVYHCRQTGQELTLLAQPPQEEA